MKLKSEKLAGRIIKGGTTVFVFSLLSSPIGYFLRLIYAHTLSVEMYGLFYSVLALFSLLTTYNDLGVGYSVSYFIPKAIKSRNYQLCWNLYKYDQLIEVSTSIFISSLLFIAAPWLAINYFKMPQAEILIYLLSLYCIVDGFISSLSKFFTGLQQERFYSSIHPTRLVFTLLFSLFFWVFDFNYIYYFAIAWSVAYVVVAVIYWIAFKRENVFLIRKTTFDKKLIKTMFRYAIPTLLTTSIFSFISSTNIILLTYFRGVSEVGIYNVIFPIAAIANIFLSPINALFFPLVSELMDGNNKVQVKQLANSILKLIPYFSLYFGLFIYFFPVAPISFLFGQKWVELAKDSLMILALVHPFSILSSFLSTLVSGMGLVNERFKISLILGGISIVSGAGLIMFYGVIGAVISGFLVYLTSVFLLSRLMNQKNILTLPIRDYIKILIFGITTISIVNFYGLQPTSWLQYIIFGVVYSVIYVIFGLTSKVLSPQLLIVLKQRKYGYF